MLESVRGWSDCWIHDDEEVTQQLGGAVGF